jgi:predicted hotdog family 3-hydroxylacyl-ACP dehydratase
MTGDDGDLAIERLIPHRLPMRLVEIVDRADQESIETRCTVRDAWPTVQHGSARTLMLVEVVAQSAAALQGWRERHEHATGQGGLLVGVPIAKLASPTIPVGTELLCKVQITHGVQSYMAFDGTVTDRAGVLWLSASIQAYRPDASDLSGESP